MQRRLFALGVKLTEVVELHDLDVELAGKILDITPPTESGRN